MSNTMEGRRKAPGIGSTRRGDASGTHKGVRRIVVSFDDETFEIIRHQATKSGHSFAQQVRLLVEWGLEA